MKRAFEKLISNAFLYVKFQNDYSLAAKYCISTGEQHIQNNQSFTKFGMT